ncbi:hypothetical protein CCACVL1_18982 [Corchorus capsularis]|uniref:Uncharacterized protein n=1 Tax=Corchorus capsularis TaxID=210143 RepID=A0A1R3HJ60_COCAP|nr:hypothetical protein CCACVL1_18982 [Corchorus capsularis]
MKEMDKARVQIGDKMELLAAREVEVAGRERRVNARDNQVGERTVEVTKREHAVRARVQAVESKEKALAEKDKKRLQEEWNRSNLTFEESRIFRVAKQSAEDSVIPSLVNPQSKSKEYTVPTRMNLAPFRTLYPFVEQRRNGQSKVFVLKNDNAIVLNRVLSTVITAMNKGYTWVKPITSDSIRWNSAGIQLSEEPELCANPHMRKVRNEKTLNCLVYLVDQMWEGKKMSEEAINFKALCTDLELFW